VAGGVVPTVGVLEMGGSTLQVAMEVFPTAAESAAFPPGLVLPERNPVDCGAATHQLLVLSVPGFGGNAARERYLEHLSKDGLTTDPCMLPGQSEMLPDSSMVLILLILPTLLILLILRTLLSLLNLPGDNGHWAAGTL
jgi:Golgi nucleoside diphosphatase